MSQDGGRAGEAAAVGDGAGPGELKPGQIDLLTAMLASMWQEQAQR